MHCRNFLYTICRVDHAVWLSSLLVVVMLAAPIATAQTQSVQTRPVPLDKDYVIGPEDVLDIQVWGSKDLNQTVFVRPDGRLSVPVVGEIAAGGKTVQQLQDHLSAVYANMVKGAVVTVIVKEIRSRPVYFIGGFGNPGVMQLTRDLTLLQAISVVGGVVPNADGEKGFLLRGNNKIPIDFTRLVQRGDLSQNPKLQPGDSVVVPLADVVYVSGEVRKPGTVKYTGDLSPSEARSEAPPRQRTERHQHQEANPAAEDANECRHAAAHADLRRCSVGIRNQLLGLLCFLAGGCAYETQWRPEAVVSIYHGGVLHQKTVAAPIEMLFDSETAADTYSLVMAKKWIDDNG